MSLKDELSGLKADFVSLQTYLKERLSLIEIRITEIENKIPRHDSSPESRFQEYVQQECNTIPIQELDNKTRNIIEELMWEGTLTDAVLQVRETFKDNAREKFLRCSFEMVLEKDEQYRKMTGTLFGHLISQNVVSSINIFNSLSSVLLVIENSNNYNTKMWKNLSEILLPIISESHIKFSQLKRKAQAILKQEYYCEFINHLNNAIESSRKKVTSAPNSKADPQAQIANLNQSISSGQAGDEKEPPNANCIDLQNVYEIESISKFKPVFASSLEIEPPKYNVEALVNSLNNGNRDDAIQRLKTMSQVDLKSVIEEIVDIAVHKEPEHRITIGRMFVTLLSEDILDMKQILTSFCKSVLKLERLVLNQKTRFSICEAYADIAMPLFTENKIKLDHLSTIASLTLSEETKTIFIWSMEKALHDRGVVTEPQTTDPPTAVNSKMLKRLVKYMGKSGRAQTEKGETADDGARTGISPENAEKQEKHAEDSKNELKFEDNAEEQTERDTFLSLKRKKLLKERIENIGDKMDLKIDDLLNGPANKKTQEVDAGDTQLKTNGQKIESDLPPVKQPENLPSSAIKEKMMEIIEHLMETGNTEDSVNMIKDTFNECQTDLVFKAAFEYTKMKPSEYRIQCGNLISEAFKHDPKRIGAQIMNTISLELGDFVDAPELWNSMAEIICPPIINGLIRFTDLKLLPKYFLHTNSCASLLLAIFKQILHQRGPEWLEDNWKKSKVDLAVFLPSNLCYRFVTDNNLQFCFTNDELMYYKENSSD